MEFLRVLQVAFGIGLVIFVHELGHYIAARLCGVRVETFSLGFGPPLLKKRVGATLYQLAIVPIGGFCRMAGEERRWDGLEPRDDELPSKSVEARFFIYSAGVLMNVAFVLVVFPILFTVGVPFVQPRVGDVVPGGPAWLAGIEPGTEVLRVDDNPVYEFNQIRTEVLLAGDEVVTLSLREPDSGREYDLVVEPQPSPDIPGFTSIGVLPELVRDPAGDPRLEIAPDSPAFRAGLRTGDALVRVSGADPELPPVDQLDDSLAAGSAVTLTVRGDAGEREVVVAPDEGPRSVRRVGVAPARCHVLGVRPASAPERLGLVENDRLLEVGGRSILRRGDLLDALRSELGVPTTFRVQRAGEGVLEIQGSLATEEEARAFVEDVALGLDLDDTRIVVQPGEPAALAGIRDGDRVRKVGTDETRTWNEVLVAVRAASASDEPVRFELERAHPEGRRSYPEIEVVAKEFPQSVYGLGFRHATYVYRSESFGAAIAFGFYSSLKTFEELWFALKGMIVGPIRMRDALGGPVTIVRVSYTIAEAGWPEFFLFLCFISMNLALFNVLPIPVLDGGHLFFLIVEKLKGSPVSDRVLGYSQMVGVVLILSLLVFVTYNDVVRWLRL